MRSKLIATLLLVVMVLGICGCAQSAHSTPAEDKETETVEESIPAADNVDEKELAAKEIEAPAQEQVTTEEPHSEEDGVETVIEESLETAADAEDYENSEVYKEFMEMMEALGESPVQSEGNTSSTPEPEPDPYYEEPFELPTRTHEKAQTIVTEIADNFKSGPYYAELKGAALEYLDVNLNTLRTDPESDETLSNYMESYKNGGLTEGEFVYLVESWIRVAGPYGGQNITVQ